MPRKPRKVRVMKPPALSEAWRTFFSTGASGNKTAEDCDIFMVQAHYKLMLAAWLPHREMFLKEWKREGKKGLPWIVKELRRLKKIQGI